MYLPQMKLKIIELATGNENVEGWSFLEDWGNGSGVQLSGVCRLDEDLIIFKKNFAILGFREGRFVENAEYLRQFPNSMALWPHMRWEKMDDILILNLASRKKFWMKTKTLVQLMKEKGSAEDNHGIPYNEYDVHRNQFLVYSIKTRTNGIEIQCGFETRMPAGGYAYIG